MPQTTRHAVQKKQKLFRRETPKTPRFTEKNFSATFGDFGEVQRISFFLFDCDSRWVEGNLLYSQAEEKEEK
ncbi:hypothetical protein L0337_28530 [candidate division KSB1 bacterium]|nr:hypothetical protein [candidate division KSB1 bacterium]